MNKRDVWQGLLEAEKERLIGLTVEELMELDELNFCEARGDGVVFPYQLWHHVRCEDVPYASAEEAGSLAMQIERQMGIARPQREWHSFVLVGDRKLGLGAYRRFLTGFALDQDGKVVPIDDEVLYSFD